MNFRFAILFTNLSVLLVAAEDEAVLRSWLVNPSANAAIRAVLPEVHRVESTAREVIVHSAGLSLNSFGALEANHYEVPSGVRSFVFRLPRHPQRARLRPPVPLGIVGALVTGVPLFNPVSPAAYRDQNLWHRDAVALAARQPSGISPLLAELLRSKDRHSPIIGYALDGYPIYGPFGRDVQGGIRRMRTSYRLRQLWHRSKWPDGTELTPGQWGPDVSSDYPLGTFTEDYEYVPGHGDLDESNSCWAVTPEYPQGTYAYFLTSDDLGHLAYPYLVGPVYRGQTADLAKIQPVAPKAGEPFEIKLNVRNRAGRQILFLEKIHQQPLHLLIVSDDLAEFAHIHPVPLAGRGFTVTHTFAHGGRYHLYADYSIPGEGPVVKHSVVTVEGRHRTGASWTAVAWPTNRPLTQSLGTLTTSLSVGEPLRSGVDLPFEVTLTDRATGQPVTDLEPFLGAWAHFVVVSADHEDFIHAHPLEEGAAAVASETDPHLHATVTGPSPSKISTSVGFRRPGNYRLWAQFARHGQVITIPFAFTVAAGLPVAAPLAIPSGAIRVDVSGRGFEPAQVTVAATQRVRLAFVRRDAQNCGSRVMIPVLGITRTLVPGGVTLIEFDAPSGGQITFNCGMGMMRGAIVVRSGDEP